MTSTPCNLLADLPRSTLPEEQFSELLRRPGLRIERIVSTGHASPPGFWYDQPAGEWVMVIAGEAILEFADGTPPCHLKTGDCLDLAPHRKHRLAWTSTDRPTVWLAVHYSGTAGVPA